MRARWGTPLGTVSWLWARELSPQGEEGHLDNASPREGHTRGHTMGGWSLVRASVDTVDSWGGWRGTAHPRALLEFLPHSSEMPSSLPQKLPLG